MTKDGYALIIIVFIMFGLGVITGKELNNYETFKCIKVEAVKKPYERCFIKE